LQPFKKAWAIWGSRPSLVTTWAANFFERFRFPERNKERAAGDILKDLENRVSEYRGLALQRLASSVAKKWRGFITSMVTMVDVIQDDDALHNIFENEPFTDL
jgi:hypothetical protein